MLKIEIEVNKCLDLISKQKTTNFFFGTDQMEIDIDFLIQKGVLVKKNSAYILQDDYLDIILQEKISNSFPIKIFSKILFIFKPIIDLIKKIK